MLSREREGERVEESLREFSQGIAVVVAVVVMRVQEWQTLLEESKSGFEMRASSPSIETIPTSLSSLTRTG